MTWTNPDTGEEYEVVFEPPEDQGCARAVGDYFYYGLINRSSIYCSMVGGCYICNNLCCLMNPRGERK